jgi:hypothetical protein
MMGEENIMTEQKDSSNKRSGLGLVGGLGLMVLTVVGTVAGLETDNRFSNLVHSYSPAVAEYRIASANQEAIVEPVATQAEPSVYLQRAQALETAVTKDSSNRLSEILDQYVCDTWSGTSGTPRRFDVSSLAFLHGMVGDEGINYLDGKDSLGSVNSELVDIFEGGFGSDQGQLYGWGAENCPGVSGGSDNE